MNKHTRPKINWALTSSSETTLDRDHQDWTKRVYHGYPVKNTDGVAVYRCEIVKGGSHHVYRQGGDFLGQFNHWPKVRDEVEIHWARNCAHDGMTFLLPTHDAGNRHLAAQLKDHDGNHQRDLDQAAAYVSCFPDHESLKGVAENLAKDDLYQDVPPHPCTPAPQQIESGFDCLDDLEPDDKIAVQIETIDASQFVECPNCQGRSKHSSLPCPTCDNFGEVKQKPFPQNPGDLPLTQTVEKPENDSSVLPDSGKRSSFSTGAVRDAAPGKGWPHMVPPESMRRVDLRFEQGGTKYGETNWMKGIPLSRYYSAMTRHLRDWMEGKTDEDHLAAVGWNYHTAVWTEQEIYAGRLPRELMDFHFRTPDFPEMQEFLAKCASKEGVVV